MPDFVNSYSLLPWILATASVCVVLTALVLALRMFTKVVVIKLLDWTDCMSHLARLTVVYSRGLKTYHAQIMPFLVS
jgi:hypothetical protein